MITSVEKTVRECCTGSKNAVLMKTRHPQDRGQLQMHVSIHFHRACMLNTNKFRTHGFSSFFSFHLFFSSLCFHVACSVLCCCVLLCTIVLLCDVVCCCVWRVEERGRGVYASNTSLCVRSKRPVCTFKTSPCVPATRPSSTVSSKT